MVTRQVLSDIFTDDRRRSRRNLSPTPLSPVPPPIPTASTPASRPVYPCRTARRLFKRKTTDISESVVFLTVSPSVHTPAVLHSVYANPQRISQFQARTVRLSAATNSSGPGRTCSPYHPLCASEAIKNAADLAPTLSPTSTRGVHLISIVDPALVRRVKSRDSLRFPAATRPPRGLISS